MAAATLKHIYSTQNRFLPRAWFRALPPLVAEEEVCAPRIFFAEGLGAKFELRGHRRATPPSESASRRRCGSPRGSHGHFLINHVVPILVMVSSSSSMENRLMVRRSFHRINVSRHGCFLANASKLFDPLSLVSSKPNPSRQKYFRWCG